MAVKLVEIAAASLVLLGLAGCGPTLWTLNALANAGAIDETAPVIAHAQAEIAVSPARVWALLVDAHAWPSWQTDISTVSTGGPLAPGQRFTWSEGGTTVHSQVQLLEPDRRLGWTGTAYTAKAIHLWRLTPEPNGHTLVAIEESMDGPLMATFVSSQQLTNVADTWLKDLKRAAERKL